MKFLAGALTAFALVFVKVKWSRPIAQERVRHSKYREGDTMFYKGNTVSNANVSRSATTGRCVARVGTISSIAGGKSATKVKAPNPGPTPST